MIEVIKTKEDKIDDIKATSKNIMAQKLISSTQFICCFFFCKAAKLKYEGIPNIFDKTLELIRNATFKFPW